MLYKWSRNVAQIYRFGAARRNFVDVRRDSYGFRRFSTAAAAASTVEKTAADGDEKKCAPFSEVKLQKMFWSRPCSLALPPDSPKRIEEPNYEGIKHFIFKLLLYYSRQSKLLRGANVIYHRVITQVDSPAIYNVFGMEKAFRTTFSLLILHVWLSLRRLKKEGEDGIELGQYVYENYNHDVELRASKAGVNLLLSRWMRELEKIFYGNVVAYEKAMLPEAKPDALQNALWKNVLSDNGVSKPDAAELQALQALTRHVRRECDCLSLTDKEAMFSGNFMFTSLENPKSLMR